MTFRKIIFLISISLLAQLLVAQTQIGEFGYDPCEEVRPTGDPCDDEKPPEYIPVPVRPQDARQSSTKGNNIAGNAGNGDFQGAYARTNREFNPWWEVDLGKPFTLDNLQIWYDEGHYTNQLRNFYVLVSPYPFETDDLAAEIGKECVGYTRVNGRIPSGGQVPLDGLKGQYVRVQLGGNNKRVLSLTEVTGDGLEEICDNGIDDDCDGLVDCADPDCAGFITNANYE